ncbi:hypothetical protein MesoLj113c_46040 [Mesorhizobium sp. 113-3-9]|uniref:hypothetical protein n=1 Tax=Mesorhizobium sp. 113-3-9 TaxID=2744517 RepID=UPI0019273E71|nr:hypothetical protein [Mesorhizobium sp. 113-3-9]BCG88494.1 hypothetical protein MesoLj113c_46040 [Mesorhizobium sp. 113-3-9]
MADANAARPVTAGGTGATSPVGGHDAFNTQGQDIASAATPNIAAATGAYLNITGTVTITGFTSAAAGIERETTFTGVLTLTHNATSLILPSAANIVTAAGDVARWRSLGSGNWKCVGFTRASGAPTVNTLTQPSLILKQSAAPTPTADGDVQWDTDDNILLIGDGAAAQTFVPFPASVVAGDLFYASSAKALVRLAKGTAGQALVMNAGATAPSWAALPLSKSFESAQQTVTNGGSLTLAHSLGASPKLIQVSMICQTAERSYSIGDEVVMNPSVSDPGSNGHGFAVTVDATNVNVRFSANAPLTGFDKSSGFWGNFTNGNWKLVVRAWA